MNHQEFLRLRGYMEARRSKPFTSAQGRRYVKGRAKHVGSILKRSRVISSNPEKYVGAIY